MLVISLKALLDGSGVYDVPGVGRPLDERLSLPHVLRISVEECWPIPATWPNTGYRRLLPLPLAELFAAIRTMVLLPPYHISISTSPLSITMPAQDVPRPYPLIDSDPHAGRVIRYMRSSDYGVWAGATAAGPGLLYLYGEVLICRMGGRKHGDGAYVGKMDGEMRMRRMRWICREGKKRGNALRKPKGDRSSCSD